VKDLAPRPRLTAFVRKFQLGRPAARLDTVRSGLEAAAHDAGVRETLSLLAEAIVDLLGCSDCVISAADLERMQVVDLAGYTRTPERWEMFADQYDLTIYPATVRVLEEGVPYTTWIGDPGGDPGELALMRSMELSSQLLLRMEAGGLLYLVEAWDDRLGPFDADEIRLSERLVERGARLVELGLARDAEDEARFQELVVDAARVAPLDVDATELAIAVGETLGLNRDQLTEVRLVALLHQAGMDSIPQTLLQKTEPLTPVEWAVIQRHTLVGRRMIERIPSLSAAVDGVSAMRERWDGTGYPRGLAGNTIPLSARVVAPCVAYRAMRAGSPRRPAASHEAAIAELRRSSGLQFDPMTASAVCLSAGPDGVRSLLRLRASRI
jgi:hypothetical protein